MRVYLIVSNFALAGLNAAIALRGGHVINAVLSAVFVWLGLMLIVSDDR